VALVSAAGRGCVAVSIADDVRRVLLGGLLVVLSLLSLGAGSPTRSADATVARCSASATRSNHISLWLTGMPEEATPAHPFYVAAEDDGRGRFEVLGGAHVCNETASVRYATAGQTATSGIDFERRAGVASFTIVHLADPRVVRVPLDRDGSVEAPLEWFRVSLSHPRNGSLRAPSSAPFYIVDVDGTDRATLDGEPYQVEEFEGIVEVAVFRAGPAEESMGVPFTVSPSGQTPATPGEDYAVETADPIAFGPGDRLRFIRIGIVDDGAQEPDETFVVSLPDASPDGFAQTTVTVGGDIDVSPPRSRFHHPREGWRYDAEDYRIREIHVFTNDVGDSGVERMTLALRRNASGGGCAWWNGTRFATGDCSEPRWLRMRAYEAGWFYYYRIDPLRPSVGSSIRNYTAFAQGVDAAGNVEEDFIDGRNRNTFEVTRR
jgi:Calx-beta domain